MEHLNAGEDKHEDKPMKFLVIGGGSMGKRRIRCLMANGIDAGDIRLVDPREDRREESRSKYGVDGLNDIQSGLNWNPDAAMVCVSGERAANICATLLEGGKSVFCEVPMGLNADETRKLGMLAQQRGLLAACGAQQPFHPLIKQCRQWLKDPAFGKPLAFTLDWGQYVPGWHPYEPLSVFYSASQLTAVMTLEISQLYEITGDRIATLKCLRRQTSTLQTPGGDVCDIIGDTRGGMAVSMHFDLLQRSMRNIARFTSEQGLIELDFAQDHSRRYIVADKQWETVPSPKGYSYEQCYIDEIALFLRCIAGKAQWHNPVAQVIDIVSVFDAMHRDARQSGEKV
ncbi:MAG: Gfo/Idh/MocA family oxidoreductase [Phycisphaerales bacterium]|jgi:predicted dehydrogenase|nr:Gfo/Idh/MocA family oxidoreductase [Phycisphaerales bacterium]